MGENFKESVTKAGKLKDKVETVGWEDSSKQEKKIGPNGKIS